MQTTENGSIKPDRNPLVAILTPVYNGEQFLRETMECVQDTDYPNLVHIVLDNASTDRTSEIVDSFTNRRVPVAVHRNLETIPMGDNFNKVVRLTPPNAEYFRLLCADDVMAPTAIRKKVALAESDEEIIVVGCQCRNVGVLGTELPREQEVFSGRDLVADYLRRETMVFCGTHMLFRRSSIRDQEDFFDASLTCDDADAAVRETLKGKFGFIHEELALFRHHPEGHSATVNSDGTFLFEWLVLLDRYGPQVLSPEEYAQCRKAYRRMYLRQALLSRFRDRNKELFKNQMHRLERINDSAKITHFADAILDWGYGGALGKRRGA